MGDVLEKCARCAAPVLHKRDLCLACSALWRKKSVEFYQRFLSEPVASTMLCLRCKSPNEVEFGGLNEGKPLCRSCREEWERSVDSFYFLFLNTYKKETSDEGRCPQPAS